MMLVRRPQILKMMAMFKFILLILLLKMVLICTHNCNGLKNVNNFQNYVSVLYDRHISFSLLQETFWDDDYVNGIRHMYEGVIYESNGKNCRQGVAIMISNNYKESSKLVFKDDNGRFIHVTYDYLGKVYNLVSLYAPNNYSERKEFFMFVREYISSLENLIVGGDFNTTLSSLDRGGLSKHICDEAYKELFEIIHSCNVYDVWRSRNENKKIFSWKRITNGPGLWVLNNTLLHNDEYVQKVRNIINEAVQSSLYTVEPLVWWDNLKFRIKKFSQVFSVNLAKEKKKDFFKLQNKIQRICAMQADGIAIDVTKLENLKLELNNYELEKCKGAVLRSKAIWASESDKNTIFFLNLEKYKQENNAVKELINDKGDVISDTDGILDIEYSFL
ncbi:unnamed protein product [Mytilus edulis]|uniref:Endonuclease/exonuclease/phosphatase domain-containing protein n=1 Tax=Mytilus edulis TaxID=6550 RepID=A0A8S3QJW1_MYTED|nr:unnamed protein product [Mytilus edulis]